MPPFEQWQCHPTACLFLTAGHPRPPDWDERTTMGGHAEDAHSDSPHCGHQRDVWRIARGGAVRSRLAAADSFGTR